MTNIEVRGQEQRKKKGALENKLERPAIQIIEAVQHKMDRHQSTLHGCIV